MEVVFVGSEDSLEDGAVMVVNANVVGEVEDKVGMDRTVQGEDRPQRYVVVVDNTWNPYHAVVDEEVVRNEEVVVVKKVK